MNLGFVREPNTLIVNVKKIHRGKIFELNLKNFEVKETDYVPANNLRNQQNFEELDSVLKRSILDKMDNTQETALGLSGGLDSLIIALCAFEAETKMTAISVGFPKHNNPEIQSATERAQRFNMRLINSNLDPETAAKLYSKVTYIRDEPISDISGPAIYKIFELANENKIRIVHFGLGGDEFFWGYDWEDRKSTRLNSSHT